LPGGYRFSNGEFTLMGSSAYFLSSSEASSNAIWFRYLDYGESQLARYSEGKRLGYSVRCVKD